MTESRRPARRSRRGPGDRNNKPRQARRPSPAEAGLDQARLAARDVLRAVRERDAYANLVLPALLRERRLDGRDAALATELTYGAARAQGLLDAVIAACAHRPVTEIDGALLDTLRLGTYQLLRTRIAPHAAVATSVDIVRGEFGHGKSGFVNAVLRRVAEKPEEQWIAELAPDPARDPVGHLAFRYAHPEWIAKAFAVALGPDAGELEEVLAADDARPVVHLVARPGVITAEELALATGGEIGPWSPYAVHLDAGGDPGKLDAVREGMAGVQDEGSQLVARALTLAPLDGPDRGRWLDLCAGPGGKAALLGALADIDGFTVDAVEPVEHRAELVRKSTRGLPVTVHVADGREPGLGAGYDRILVDAPCTGLGALRRRPESRWRRNPGDVAELVRLQKQLLASAIGLLRPGGVVLYATCSPHTSETLAVVADAVRRHRVEQLDTRELVPGVPRLGDGPSVQLWPHRHGTDAMFMAALRAPAS
ncbi:methyltransferase [Rhodococcus ruber Chol-4]|uniref:RsmB/NOP family class I SAM-dependent RNA methyltransferase n=3 Tax=Rhodococcus TaxID=1827 RepID=UPI0003484954|nr:transcription antitermination factor NusB [Rhodococcus ruber]ATQ27783.1 methyltransferase [Rhodococcus ruber]KXF86624.1 methyltransferase [Rhodococcus ruber Chol-4]MDO2377775.1 transcription antitermination factor NusB [Rhodococcus ruber]